MPAWDPWPWLPQQPSRHTQTHTQILEERGMECQLLALSVPSAFSSFGVQMIHVLLIQVHEYDRSK